MTSEWGFTRKNKIALVTFAIFIIYPLSVGPAAGILTRAGITGEDFPAKVLTVVYFPVIAVATLTGTEETIKQYIHLFDPHQEQT